MSQCLADRIGNCDPAAIMSNTCCMEQLPKSSRRIEIPEVGHAEFFDVDTAGKKPNWVRYS